MKTPKAILFDPRQLTEKEQLDHQVKMFILYQELYKLTEADYLASWGQSKENQ